VTLRPAPPRRPIGEKRAGVIFPSLMNTKCSSLWSLQSPSAGTGLLVTGAVIALSASMLGCSKSEAATARPSTSEAAAAAPVAASSKSDTDNFTAEIKAGPGYKAGAEGAVEVFLTPKGGYHTNAQYPYKFKLSEPAPEGVSFPKPVLVRADGSFEEKKGYFKVPFVAAKAGKVTIAGTLYLSVCSDANCIMDKVALEVPVDVN
jgi:hypothetical protein